MHVLRAGDPSVVTVVPTPQGLKSVRVQGHRPHARFVFHTGDVRKLQIAAGLPGRGVVHVERVRLRVQEKETGGGVVSAQ